LRSIKLITPGEPKFVVVVGMDLGTSVAGRR